MSENGCNAKLRDWQSSRHGPPTLSWAWWRTPGMTQQLLAFHGLETFSSAAAVSAPWTVSNSRFYPRFPACNIL
jgi:hypothetical protein